MSSSEDATRPSDQVSPHRGTIARLRAQLDAPVDIAALAFFRVAFGLIVGGEILYALLDGDPWRLFGEPNVPLGYPGLTFVTPLPAFEMALLYGALSLLAFCIALGLFYRASVVLFTVGYGYVFLCESVRHWTNHMYLECLLALLLCFLPAHRALSLDVLRRAVAPLSSAPALWLWLLRAQIAIVYVHAGLAKLDADWLQGRFLQANRPELLRALPFAEPLFSEEVVLVVLATGAMAFDLFIAPLLVWRRTRAWAFALSLVFHGLNALFWSIGAFPYLMIAATTLFFEPSWPRRILGAPPTAAGGLQAPSRAAYLAVAIWLSVQALVPLQHLLYEGPTRWHEQGRLFAWRMMVSSKPAAVLLVARDHETGATHAVMASQLLPHGRHARLCYTPHAFPLLARHLREELVAQGWRRVTVHAEAFCALNGRPPARLVDPEVDLASEPVFTLRKPRWLLPFVEEGAEPR